MQQNCELVYAMAARCVNTSAGLREYLFNGQELARTMRRDIATAASLLVALSIELEEGLEEGQPPVFRLRSLLPARYEHAQGDLPQGMARRLGAANYSARGIDVRRDAGPYPVVART